MAFPALKCLVCPLADRTVARIHWSGATSDLFISPKRSKASLYFLT
uniref:Uncharacterized protein n=1 Tax=Arundo donax TaxID=35708 RepID=A0A0A9AAX6_ARUDO